MKRDGLKSLKLNMILNAIKGLMSVLFPLITFPYVSRVLGVESVGRFNFACSVINYFILLAGLGISTYAIREGARIREKKDEFQYFASQLLCINLVATMLSYVLLLGLLLFVSKFSQYRTLLLILSLQLIFKTIGVEWLYSIYEDYVYITIRGICFQILSLVLLFSLVKSPKDINVYACITVLSIVGSNIVNLIYSHKYIKFICVKRIDWKEHVKPIMVLFAMTATVTIYVSSDITILGFLCGDYSVGIYSVSTKIYTIVKTVLSSIIVVSIPRLSSFLGNDDMQKFNFTADDIYKTLITFVAPTITGIIVLDREIVMLISSEKYLDAELSLAFLSIALFFCMGAWFWGQCILVPCKRETVVFAITIVSSSINVLLNLVMIPLWKENAAAITTIIAEGVSFVLCSIVAKKYVKINGLIKHYFKVSCGCLIIILVSVLVHRNGYTYIINIGMIVPISVILYFLVEVLLKNESIYNVFIHMKNRKLND